MNVEKRKQDLIFLVSIKFKYIKFRIPSNMMIGTNDGARGAREAIAPWPNPKNLIYLYYIVTKTSRLERSIQLRTKVLI